MLKDSVKLTAWSFVALTFICLPTQATILVSGTNTQLFVPGTSGQNAIGVGYDSTNASIQSTFSTNFLVKGDGLGSSAPITFSTAPTTLLGGLRYFIFVLDVQETKNNESVSLDELSISVNGNIIWRTTDTILINSNPALLTPTPQGNGADFAFYVPVKAFNGFGLTGSSTFIFNATHSLGSGGNEEWLFTDRGIPSAITFYQPNQTVQDLTVIVPEPSTTLLVLISGAAMAYCSRKR